MTMSVDLPECPSKPDVDPDAGHETRTYEFKLITPMMGGGVEPGKPDPVTPIRGTSIRGQLRFWWRATVGARYETAEELAAQEGEVWGAMEEPSPVEIHVKTQGEPGDRKRNDGRFYGFDNGPESYALFPLRQESHPLIKEGFEFNLEVRWPEDVGIGEDVQTALEAWANFGGIGARTRRGLGAVYCPELAFEEPEKVSEWLGEHNLLEFGEGGRSWSVLSTNHWFKHAGMNDALTAWSDVLSVMKEFRHGKGTGRNPSGKFPGRSHWPEPETIRKVMSQRDSGHGSHPPFDKHPEGFPRAAFGLPIIFHFNDGEDPDDSKLLPVVDGEKRTRMASPLILRPMKFSSGGTAAWMAWLDAPTPDRLKLDWEGRDREFGQDHLENESFTKYPKSPMHESSALEAIQCFASKREYQELVVE